MTAEWHPRIGRRTLRGVSAHGLSVAGSWSLGVGIVCIVAAAVLLWVADQAFLAFLVSVPGALGMLTSRTLGTMVGTRVTREAAAGYTTLVSGSGPAEVEHVEARTGRLVSLAGEDLTRAERRARVAAVRADARLGIALPDDAPAAGGDADEALFFGRPRTFVTLPLGVRQGGVWGLLLAALAPVGFVVVALLDSDAATRPAAVVVLAVQLVTCVVATVLLVVALRRADRILAEGGPGGSARSRGAVLGLWIFSLGFTVIFAGIFAVGRAVAGAATVVSVPSAERSLLMSAVWSVAWFVAWIVLVRRAAGTEELDSP